MQLQVTKKSAKPFSESSNDKDLLEIFENIKKNNHTFPDLQKINRNKGSIEIKIEMFADKP